MPNFQVKLENFDYLCIVKPINWGKMKKSIILLFVSLMPMFLFGQSYKALWSKVTEAEEKDLPQTEYAELQKIVKKATKEKAYGQLLKAELQSAQVMAEIAPDSLKPTMMEMKQRCETVKDEVLKTVWQTVLWRVSSKNYSLGLGVEEPELTEALCQKMARLKDDAYSPMIVKGIDAGIFNNDLLHVIGYELDEEDTLHEFYSKTGNRRAACITAADAFEYNSLEEIDSLIKVYEDLPECGELAILRYNRAKYKSEVSMGEKLDKIHEALQKWGSWKRIGILKNAEQEMTNPQYYFKYDQQLVLPQQSQTVKLEKLRNISSLTMKVYRVNAEGDYSLSPNYTDGYKKIQPLLGEVVCEETRTYTGKEPYEFFEDELTLQGLPVGVYMVEIKTDPVSQVSRHLYYVSEVYTIAEAQPIENIVRYVVVNAKTGQPIVGAHLRIREDVGYKKVEETNGVTGEKGEYFYHAKRQENRREVFAYTESDKACPTLDGNNHYSYYNVDGLDFRTCIYTDRAIYRPGQTVHASVILYHVIKGINHKVRAEAPVTLTLRDANYKLIDEKSLVTDDYGTCSAEFTLPSTGLTGRFTLEAERQRYSFQVEEYKRPTFHVDFSEVKEAYAAGDTLTVKGTALSYAGVPVQGAKVSYKVLRRTAYWWWSYSRYWETAVIGRDESGVEVSTGKAVTGDDGTFDVTMPLKMPETSYPMFYHFVVIADVTDTAGETRTGEMSLPLGNRKQALSMDLEEKVLLEDQPKVTFHLMNAAGKDLDAQVKYRIDNGQWLTAKTNSQLSITNSQLKSGKHTIEATCENDTISRHFVLFSAGDLTPATDTDDWFWQSDTQFPNNGKPVTIQVGSSDKDVHIVYSIFAGGKIIEQGSFEKSNQLINLKLTYEEEYGNGLLLTFAWVKDRRLYTHTAQVRRPLPDKRLKMQWKTFRDRLKPGQQEEWTLTIKDCNGKTVDAQLMATLYDASLDQLKKHAWNLVPYISVPMPSTSWNFLSLRSLSDNGTRQWSPASVDDLEFSTIDEDVLPSFYSSRHRYTRGLGEVMRESRVAGMPLPEPMMMEKMVMNEEPVEDAADQKEEEQSTGDVQMRENLNETAFFYPQLVADKDGNVGIKFTLPECLTTWRFLGVAHTKEMFYGTFQAEAVAQKDVMIQPNVPRFIREEDEAAISARIFNTGELQLTGKALLKLIDPETNKTVLELTQPVTLKPGSTTPVTFNVSLSTLHSPLSTNLLICQMSVSGKDFSDGEQHYLPVLPSTERVTVSLPITQHHQGEEKIDLTALIPSDAKNGKFTFEYTNHPAWLMIQALPTVGNPIDDNAISQAASYYANAIGKYILGQNPQAKTAFALWKKEAQDGQYASLTSQLEKNQELKDLLLNETPWVLDAERETEQRQRLGDFFDENLMQNRLNSAVEKLKKLQLGDGSWTWWKGMQGSFYMTVAVSEMLVRLNDMAGEQQPVKQMLNNAFEFMGNEIVKEVKDLKEWEKDGHKATFPTFKTLQWLYLATLDGRELPSKVQAANDYLLKLLKKEVKSQSIYEKALTAVILSKSDPKRALEYAQSLKEYTVFKEETGRYYDTPRAGYSWYDYKIPTQTVAIEALQRLTPDDQQTIEEMQRWLLQEKRTQAWDTPINSVNAVYAFLGRPGEKGNGNSLHLDADNASIQVDGKALDLPKATAAIGYVKTGVPADSKQLSINKTSTGTSWGAVYAQFFQATKNVADAGSGMKITRELLDAKGQQLTANGQQLTAKVGDRIKVRITITADRDYDFVQVIDRRAACMEPVNQLSGWRQGSYCAPHDCATNYYFDCLSKGTHVIENAYNIDRTGTYETGTCTVECAYSPEFRAITKSQTLKIE